MFFYDILISQTPDYSLSLSSINDIGIDTDGEQQLFN
jgi:hypothetical protein